MTGQLYISLFPTDIVVHVHECGGMVLWCTRVLVCVFFLSFSLSNLCTVVFYTSDCSCIGILLVTWQPRLNAPPAIQLTCMYMYMYTQFVWYMYSVIHVHVHVCLPM